MIVPEPLNVSEVDALSVVKAPVEAEEFPIGMLLMLVVEDAEVSCPCALTVKFPRV
jgi:hypothetical protein